MAIYTSLKRAFNKWFRQYKEEITISHITAQSYDSHDIVTNTKTDTTTMAVAITQMDELGKYGFTNLQVGDYAFVVRKDDSVERKDTITYHNSEYIVERVEPLRTRGGIIGYVVYTKLKE